jgi:hypothetical protein
MVRLLPEGDRMSSHGKKKTTMAKLNREARLRDRRAAKQEKKEARRDAAAAVPAADRWIAAGPDVTPVAEGGNR